MRNIILLNAMLFFAIQSFAQLNLPNASPDAVIKQQVGFAEIEVKYSRPGAKGRTIFGGLVPYGEIWRTGAHDATTINVSEPISLNGNAVPAGIYSFFTIPEKHEWTIILNRVAEMHGTSAYAPENDVLRFKVKPEKSPRFYETFTIEVNDIINNTAMLYLIWENTQVKLSITTNTDQVVMAEIHDRINVKKEERASLFYQSSLYYFNTDKDLKQAYEWIQIANSKSQDAMYLQLQGKIEAALGNFDRAIKSVRTSSELARTKNLNQVITVNNELVEEWGRKVRNKQ